MRIKGFQMEGSVQKPDVSGFPKKSRSVVHNSRYGEKSRGFASKSLAENGGLEATQESKVFKLTNTLSFESRGSVPVESRRKKRRKEVSMNSFEPITKRQRNSFNASKLKPNGFVSGVGKPEIQINQTVTSRCFSCLSEISENFVNEFALSPSKKKDHRAPSIGNSEQSNGLGNNVVIPKRPRGILRQRKPESSISLKSTESNSTSNDKSNAEAQINKLSGNILSPSQASNGKRKNRVDEFKENGSGGDIYIPCIKGENGSSIQVTNKKVRRIKKASPIVKQNRLKNEAPLADKEKKYGDFQEDDVENLERNAAWMLSSRFDPRCTGFSGKRMQSSSEPANGLLFLKSVHGNFMGSGSESSSVDAVGRVLRPRKRYGKSFYRKRRHFYEVCSRAVDPYCILKQRIRVFWPLDKSWYFGLVKDYDPATRLHYVKYDDHDDEWIDLQNERIKLLLFPSEVTSEFSAKKSLLEPKQENKEGYRKDMDDDCLGDFMESEPIISWFARLNHGQKSSPTNITKKQRRTHFLKDFEPSILLEPKRYTTIPPSSRISNNLFSKLVAPDMPFDGDISEMTMLKSRTSSDDGRLSFVYFRKRFHKRKDGLNHTLEKDCGPGIADSSISILASVADRELVLDELNIVAKSMELKRVTLRLSLQPQCIHDLAFETERFWMCHALFLLQFGKLFHVWPMVLMEIVLVDNIQGLKLLLFEGSLGWVVTFLCLIITTFYQHNEQSKFVELQMPFTSIGFQLSGLHGQDGQLHFVQYSFLDLESSKWRHLEDKLKHQCTTMKELPIADCTYSKIKNLPSKIGQMLCTSVYKTSYSLEGFSERSYSDILDHLIPNNSEYLNMNPALCYIDEKYGRIPPCSLSFATAPSFLLSFHLKLLIENNAAFVRLQKSISIYSQEYPDNNVKLTINGCSPVEDPSDQFSDITIENLGSSSCQVVANSGNPAVGHLKLEIDALSVSNDGDWMKASHHFLRSEVNMIGNSVGRRDLGKNKTEETVVGVKRFPFHTGSWRLAEKACSSFSEGSSSPEKSEGGCSSCFNNNDVQDQPLGRLEEHSFDNGTQAAQSASGLAWEMDEWAIHSINPTVPRSIWHHKRHSSVSPTFAHHPKLWPEDFMWNGFASGSKKPRTQVSYSFPFGGCAVGSKPRSHQRKARSYKKIQTDNGKMISGGSESPQSYHESLTCRANVLVTAGDRGWRECGAQVVLDSDDQKDWRICIKLSGVIKYMHKAHHILLPGTTNRYTHAMMWKGGKDWTLEFTDRRQWSLFKEMHEDCSNGNVRAVYVKNIPIPGVHLIVDGDDNIVKVPLIRSSNYYWQVGTDVDMALDPSHVLYDMDTDDEEWISKIKNSSGTEGSRMSEITDDIFERVMDMFEKLAYAQQCDEFSRGEIEDFMADVGPLDMVEAIYEQWQQKRQKKGLPLIRQFQPALWEHYRKQLKKWESAMSKMHSSSEGCQNKACSVKKPPLFAFCLRPRGMEMPNKGSKQRSHKKFMFTGNHHSAFAREQDGFNSFGRKLNRLSVGEKALVSIPSYESSDCYHWHQPPSSFLPRDHARKEIMTMADYGSEIYWDPKLHRSNSRKAGMFPSRNGGRRRLSADMYEWPSSTKQSQPDVLRGRRADNDEFRLHDASGAAKHASNMARLKRERAQWLLRKADFALRKSVAALMTAEAIKESEKEVVGDG